MIEVISENLDKVLLVSVSNNDKLFTSKSSKIFMGLVLCFVVKLLFEYISLLIVKNFLL